MVHAAPVASPQCAVPALRTRVAGARQSPLILRPGILRAELGAWQGTAYACVQPRKEQRLQHVV